MRIETTISARARRRTLARLVDAIITLTHFKFAFTNVFTYCPWMGTANLPASVALERRFQQRMLVCVLSLGLLGGLVQRYERAMFVPTNAANQPSAFTAIVPPPGVAPLTIAAPRNAVARVGRPINPGGVAQPDNPPASPIFNVPTAPNAPTADAVTPPTTDNVVGSQPTAQRRNFFTGGDNPLGGAGGVEVAALPDPGAGGVPEPASWALMILGVGLVGGTLRRRRAQQPGRDVPGVAMVSDIA